MTIFLIFIFLSIGVFLVELLIKKWDNEEVEDEEYIPEYFPPMHYNCRCIVPISGRNIKAATAGRDIKDGEWVDIDDLIWEPGEFEKIYNALSGR